MTTKVFADGFEGHMKRSLDRARKLGQKESLEPERIRNFDDPLQLFEFFTAERVRLWQVAREKRVGIYELASELGRDCDMVAHDVEVLKEFGFLYVHEESGPDSSMIKVVEPTSDKLEIYIQL